jgi:hypothetical protein
MAFMSNNKSTFSFDKIEKFIEPLDISIEFAEFIEVKLADLQNISIMNIY